MGPETLALADILVCWRTWLGLAPARLLRLPMKLVRLACRAGDALGARPLSTTSLRQTEHGNAGPVAPFAAAMGLTPRAMQEALAATPAQTQDLWHARLYLLRPVMTASLVLLWLGSGIAGRLLPWAESALLSGLAPGTAGPLGAAMSMLDLMIAGALLLGRRPMLAGAAQLVVVAGYTAFLTLATPPLWLDPFGPLSMLLARRSGSVAGIAVVCRNVLRADWLCTLPSGVAQLLTGLALPAAWFAAYRQWFALGWPACIGLLIEFALMVAKPG